MEGCEVGEAEGAESERTRVRMTVKEARRMMMAKACCRDASGFVMMAGRAARQSVRWINGRAGPL